MALKKFDSFSHYLDLPSLIKKWPYTNDLYWFSLAGTAGRRGQGRINIPAVNQHYIADAFGNHETWIVGAYISYTGFANCHFQFVDSATPQVLLYQQADGRLSVYRGSTSNLLGTTTGTMFLNGSKHYVEFKAKVHGSTGTFEVRVDGLSVLSGTGANTQQSANAYANTIRLGGTTGIPVGAGVYYEDVYICDGSGSAPCNDFLGDCKVVSTFPTGNGTTSNFVGSDANSTDNYLLVYETTPNTTNYLDSLTPNDVDLVNVTDISDTPSVIYGVQTSLYVCKSDAGDVRTVADLIRSGGTNYPGAEKTLGTDWVYLCEVHEKNPNTDAAWTKTNFNSAEFGVKMVS